MKHGELSDTLRDFLRNYKILAESLAGIVKSMAERTQLNEKERLLLKEVLKRDKSLGYYAKKFDSCK